MQGLDWLAQVNQCEFRPVEPRLERLEELVGHVRVVEPSRELRDLQECDVGDQIPLESHQAPRHSMNKCPKLDIVTIIAA